MQMSRKTMSKFLFEISSKASRPSNARGVSNPKLCRTICRGWMDSTSSSTMRGTRSEERCLSLRSESRRDLVLYAVGDVIQTLLEAVKRYCCHRILQPLLFRPGRAASQACCLIGSILKGLPSGKNGANVIFLKIPPEIL